jgi:hypothetical protein
MILIYFVINIFIETKSFNKNFNKKLILFIKKF